MMTLLAAILIASSYVCPSLATDSFANSCDSNSVLVGKCLLSDSANSVSPPDFSHRLLVQFGMRESSAPYIATLAPHVIEIIGACSQEQMVWINALRNVASMANEKSIRDWPAMQLPRQAVSEPDIMRAAFRYAALKLAVSVFGSRSGPQPAPVGFIDVIPESFLPRSRHALNHARTTAIPPAVLRLIASNSKWYRACRASELDARHIWSSWHYESSRWLNCKRSVLCPTSLY